MFSEPSRSLWRKSSSLSAAASGEFGHRSFSSSVDRILSGFEMSRFNFAARQSAATFTRRALRVTDAHSIRRDLRSPLTHSVSLPKGGCHSICFFISVQITITVSETQPGCWRVIQQNAWGAVYFNARCERAHTPPHTLIHMPRGTHCQEAGTMTLPLVLS